MGFGVVERFRFLFLIWLRRTVAVGFAVFRQVGLSVFCFWNSSQTSISIVYSSSLAVRVGFFE